MWPFHRHDWNEINRQLGIITKSAPVLFGGYPTGSGTGTLITHECTTCGKNKQTTLIGTVGDD